MIRVKREQINEQAKMKSNIPICPIKPTNMQDKFATIMNYSLNKEFPDLFQNDAKPFMHRRSLRQNY